MGQNRLDSTLFLLSLKLSAGDLCLTRICILQHLLFEDTNLKKKKNQQKRFAFYSNLPRSFFFFLVFLGSPSARKSEVQHS